MYRVAPTHSPPKPSVARDVGQGCFCGPATHMTDEMEKPVIQTRKGLPPGDTATLGIPRSAFHGRYRRYAEGAAAALADRPQVA